MPTSECPLHGLAHQLRKEIQKGAVPEAELDAAHKTADDLNALGYVWEALMDERIMWHNTAVQIFLEQMGNAEANAFVALLDQGGPLTRDTIAHIHADGLLTAFMIGYELGKGEYRLFECTCDADEVHT